MFRLDKLTQKAQEALQQAQGDRRKKRKPGDVPAAFVDRAGRGEGGHRAAGAGKCDVHPDAIVSEARRLLSILPKQQRLQPGMYLSQPLNQVLERAFDEAAHFKDEFVSTEHLLLAIAEQPASRPDNSSTAQARPMTPF